MSTAPRPQMPAGYDEQADLAYAGRIVRQTREHRSLSLDEVARRARVPRANLANFELGQGDLLLGRLRRVLHVLGLTLVDLEPPMPPSVFARVMLLLYAYGPAAAEHFEGLVKSFAHQCRPRRRA